MLGRKSQMWYLVLVLVVGVADLAEAGHRCRRWRNNCDFCCVERCPVSPLCCASPCNVSTAPGATASAVPRLGMFSARTFPNVPKPEPTGHTYNGCPLEGDASGDTVLNRHKNRDDEGNYVPVSFDTVFGLLQPPHRVDKVIRQNWNQSDLETVAKYEGTPVQIDGFLAGARQEKGEKCNCNGGPQGPTAPPEMCDIHVWLTGQPDKDRTRAIVVEVTPRGKQKHPVWTEDLLKGLANNNTPVRISGWLMFDQDHYEQLNHTRGTLWEVHPIMQIEVQQNSQWVKLDDLQ
jgi:hypothetical protein